MNWMLKRVLSHIVRIGSLKITGADGRTETFGDGTGAHVHLVIHSKSAERQIAMNPWLKVPETYMDEQMDFRVGDPLDLLEIAYVNERAGTDPLFMRIGEGTQYLFRRFQQINTAARARRNVHHHYDLSGDMYRLFLDEDMQYSCAYFEKPDVSLDEAQRAKKRHIIAKLNMKPKQKVLDIGSGWGGLGIEIARQFDADLLGVTLSDEQHAVSQKRARDAKLERKARFEIADYRSLKGPFDRIVSVGMFEHVGINHYKAFFDKTSQLLKDDGVMLLHTIGRTSGPSVTNSFIRKYIFPGGYIPSLSEVTPIIEKSGLIVTDVEILRLHYADTLKHWRQRFMANRDKAKAIYDEKFCRMWEFYLAGSEASFRWQNLVVFQIQLAKRNDILPMTRNYIADNEQRMLEGPGDKAFTDAAE